MPFRVGQESGRKGWYVYVDRPKTHRPKRGGKTVRRKAGDSREEAMRNALRIEAELVQQWAADEPLSPFQAALRASRELGLRLDEALDSELRGQGYKQKDRDRRLNPYPTSSSSSKSAWPLETLSTSPVLVGLLNRIR